MAFNDEELNKRREEREKERQLAARQGKMMKIGLIMTAVTLVLCGAALLITFGYVRLSQSSEPSLETPPSTEQTAPAETTEPLSTEPDRVIHFVSGGDVNVTDQTVNAGANLAGGYDYSQVFLDVAPVLGGADLTAVNFEGSLFHAPYGTDTKSAPQQLIQALREAGVDLVQTANSYSIVNGLSGLRSTLQGISDAGMQGVGTYASGDDFRKSGGYVIRQVQGIKVAVVAFTKGMDGMGLPAGSEDCVNLLYTDYNSTYQKVDTLGITAVLQAVRAQAPDITIALLHWGSEYNNQISKTQEKIQELMLENGVDAILGAHSHYVQTVQFNKEKGTLVAYSMGDLLGDGETAGTNYSVLLDLEITKSGSTGETSITGFTYSPVYIYNNNGTLQLLRIREAIAAYESKYLNKVPEEMYTEMKQIMEKVDSRMNPEG